MAAKAGQASQIELLIVYGAEITAKDSKGNTAHEIAKQNKHSTIADRLLEATYEVTDRLSHFLCGKKPDHATGNHLLIPDQSHNEISEQLKIARGKLQLIPNKMFEELVMDLYDEVDRRETEASMYRDTCRMSFFRNQNGSLKKDFSMVLIIFFSLGDKCFKSGNWRSTIFANESTFKRNTESRTSKTSSIQSKRIRWLNNRRTA